MVSERTARAQKYLLIANQFDNQKNKFLVLLLSLMDKIEWLQGILKDWQILHAVLGVHETLPDQY